MKKRTLLLSLEKKRNISQRTPAVIKGRMQDAEMMCPAMNETHKMLRKQISEEI